MTSTKHRMLNRVSGAVLSVVVVIALAGCRSEEDLPLRMLAENKPGMERTPVLLKVGPPGQSAESVTVGDLILRLPAGWAGRVTSRRDLKKERPDLGLEEDIQAVVTARHEAHTVDLDIRYTRERSYLEHPSPSLLKTLGRGVPDPQLFLQQFRSDLEFFEAALHTTANDLRRKSGHALEKAKALLWFKSIFAKFWLRLSLQHIDAFAAIVATFEAPGRICAQVFDRNGARRGEILVKFPEGIISSDAEQLFGQLLYNSEFIELD